MKKKILLIHTGGTISMHTQESSGAVMPGDQNPMMAEREKFEDHAEIFEEEVFNLPSPHITPAEMFSIRQLINSYRRIRDIDGVVITHGTDTLEETAYFLDLTLESELPVILTGAMRTSNEIGSDGVYNLISALRVAADPEAAGKGVLVVLNDEIHTAQNVTKTHSSNVSTFQSPQYGPIGIVTKNAVRFHHSPMRQEYYNVEAITKKVMLLKVFAGMDGDIVDSAIDLAYDGIVLEGLGQGNVPPALLPAVRRAISHDIPVVLVSRCFNGIAQAVYAYPGGGRMLQEEGVIVAHGLSGQKARLKLLIGLCNGSDIRRIFS
ncbi:asparaginase [Planococcus lenghuensis]|uniref:asparaginase n=1 Tax=Planococcus lenghuensis TaxID=2213202 RepID=A0A1Q2KZM8_9BACL|nr:asparaginase [Planococcus lenghuensis]AQQ53641.1 L-asparaginase [Planococcus lenghuensis]